MVHPRISLIGERRPLYLDRERSGPPLNIEAKGGDGARLELGDNDEALEHLGMYTRIKESTLAAIGNILQGAGRTIFKGRFLKGPAQMGQGFLDALDVVPSTAADIIHGATGPTNHPRGRSPYHYNVTRAFGEFKEIEGPQNIISAIAGAVHALGTKLGSDALRAIRRSSDSLSLETPQNTRSTQLETRDNIRNVMPSAANTENEVPRRKPTYAHSAAQKSTA